MCDHIDYLTFVHWHLHAWCILLQVFVVVTLFGELWMGLVVGMLVFLYQLVAIQIKGNHVWQTRVSSNVHTVSNISRAASIDSHVGS